jgi:hypothetical protein
METDTGFYSNTINLTTLITGYTNLQLDVIQISSSENTIIINLQESPQSDVSACIYTITGQMVSSFPLHEKRNFIPVYVDRQLLIIQVQTGDQIVSRKVLVW